MATATTARTNYISLKQMASSSLCDTKGFNTVINLLTAREEGVGGTWVNFFWVCAAGLAEPLPHYSLFCGQL